MYLPESRQFRCAAVVLGILLTAACSDQPSERVTFNMSWLPQGSMSGVIVAIDQGFYSDVGLDVEATRGFGGIRTANEIDQGLFDFGYVDAVGVILNRNNGGRTRLVGGINERWPAGLCYVEQRHRLTEPKDLVGLKVGGGQNSAVQVALPLWLERNGVPRDSIELLQLAPSVIGVSLVEGQIDVAECWLANSVAVFQKTAAEAGLTIAWLSYGDFNLDIYGNGIATSERLIEEQPEVVRSFLSATYRGYLWARDNPERATAILVDHYPELDPEITLQQVHEIADLMSGWNSLGRLEESKVARTMEFLTAAYAIDDAMVVDDIYTNEFLPQDSAPREN
jgi:NitT/TauT family transport system substrate-binding protein